MEGLRIEEFVRDEDAASGERRISAEAEGAQFGEARRDAGIVSLPGFGADLDEGVRLQVADEGLRRSGDEFSEHRSKRGRGGEVRAGGLADARPVRDVIPEPRAVEGRLDEARERDHAAAGLATEQGDDGVMSGRGLHARSVMRSFPLRQTNRD